MKISNYHGQNALILMIACGLFFSSYAASPGMSPDARSNRVAFAPSAVAHPVKDIPNLIIRRIPNLGNNVIVVLYVDGVVVTPIGYGHTYEGFLPPGRHVLSVLSTPDPRWRAPWQTTLDVRTGQTYNFTAVGDGSGDLVLKGG
jgi:hypothetical protein